MSGNEIADEQFVDKQVPFVRPVKLGVLPGIRSAAGLKYTYKAGRLPQGVRLQSRVSSGWNFHIPIRIQHFLCIVVRHSYVTVNKILISVFTPLNKSIYLQPEIFSIRC